MLCGGTYCPTDGFIRPLAIFAGYQAAAERFGVRFIHDAEVTAFTLDRSGGVTHVCTAKDEFATSAVVNAAGPWAAGLALLAGAALSVTPLRRQVAHTQPTGVLPSAMPMTIFGSEGFHTSVRDDRVLLLMASPGAADPFDISVEAAWIERVSEIARRRLPPLASVAIDRAALLYEQSPDGHAILGAAAEVPIGHANIIRYCGRPYSSVGEMNFDMRRRWNEVVQPGDHVWYLGDFAMGDQAMWPKYLTGLNGRIALVLGNRDKGSQTMLDTGFVEVHDNVIVEVDGYRLWLNHFPPQAAVELEFRRAKHERPPAPGPYDIALCSHIHEKWTNQPMPISS